MTQGELKANAIGLETTASSVGLVGVALDATGIAMPIGVGLNVIGVLLSSGAAIDACDYSADANCTVAWEMVGFSALGGLGTGIFKAVRPEMNMGAVAWGGEGAAWIIGGGIDVKDLTGG